MYFVTTPALPIELSGQQISLPAFPAGMPWVEFIKELCQGLFD